MKSFLKGNSGQEIASFFLRLFCMNVSNIFHASRKYRGEVVNIDPMMTPLPANLGQYISSKNKVRNLHLHIIMGCKINSLMQSRLPNFES